MVQAYSLIWSISSDFYMFTPWSLDLFIRVPFPPHGYIQSCSHFGALNLSHTLPSLSYQVLIFTWVKWSIWGWSALSKDTTSSQCPKIERGETWYFSENPAPSGIRNRTPGSDIGEAQRSNKEVIWTSSVLTIAPMSFSIVGFGLVEMAISTNPKPTIYRNLY